MHGWHCLDDRHVVARGQHIGEPDEHVNMLFLEREVLEFHVEVGVTEYSDNKGNDTSLQNASKVRFEWILDV